MSEIKTYLNDKVNLSTEYNEYKATKHISTTRIFWPKDECFILDIVSTNEGLEER